MKKTKYKSKCNKVSILLNTFRKRVEELERYIPRCYQSLMIRYRFEVIEHFFLCISITQHFLSGLLFEKLNKDYLPRIIYKNVYYNFTVLQNQQRLYKQLLCPTDQSTKKQGTFYIATGAKEEGGN